MRAWTGAHACSRSPELEGPIKWLGAVPRRHLLMRDGSVQMQDKLQSLVGQK